MTGPGPERKPVAEAADAAGETQKVDNTPPFLQALGITAGEWQFITKPQLHALLRDRNVDWLRNPDWVRVWAYGMLHSIGYRGECAVKQVPIGEVRDYMEVVRRVHHKRKNGGVEEFAVVPLAPVDIARELKLDKAAVSRAINELEGRGIAKQEGAVKGHIRLMFYARPLDVAANLVDVLDNQNGKSERSNKVTIAVAASFRKRFFPWIKQDSLPLRPDLVADPDYQNAIAAEIKEICEKVVAPEVQKRIETVNQRFAAINHLGSGNGGAYKEESSSESSKPPGGLPSLTQPDDREVRRRFDTLWNSWKKPGASVHNSRFACEQQLREIVKPGLHLLDQIEAGLQPWVLYYEAIGWRYCKPTFADVLANRLWETIAPDPEGGQKQSSTDRAMERIYQRQMERNKKSP